MRLEIASGAQINIFLVQRSTNGSGMNVKEVDSGASVTGVSYSSKTKLH